MRSSVRRASATDAKVRAFASVALAALVLAGCSREAPDVREVRTAAQEYLRALGRKDAKEIAERSTCLVSTNSLVGGRVIRVGPPRRVRIAALDSLVQVSLFLQRAADSTWAYADEATADSMFRLGRTLSIRASVYRNAARAVPVSAAGAAATAGAALGDSTLETRVVRARVRYAGPVVGPRPVDKEEILRLLRVPGGKWVVFSFYLVADDPEPEMI